MTHTTTGPSRMGLGVVLAAGTLSGVALIPPDWAVQLLALILAGVAGSYVGFAIQDGRPRQLVYEIAFSTVELALAALALRGHVGALVLAWVLHGGWDVLHHRGVVEKRMPGWVPPFCLVYDWLVAAGITLLLL